METYGDINEFGHGNQMFDKPSMLKQVTNLIFKKIGPMRSCLFKHFIIVSKQYNSNSTSDATIVTIFPHAIICNYNSSFSII
jgi:hypothetical protein